MRRSNDPQGTVSRLAVLAVLAVGCVAGATQRTIKPLWKGGTEAEAAVSWEDERATENTIFTLWDAVFSENSTSIDTLVSPNAKEVVSLWRDQSGFFETTSRWIVLQEATWLDYDWVEVNLVLPRTACGPVVSRFTMKILPDLPNWRIDDFHDEMY